MQQIKTTALTDLDPFKQGAVNAALREVAESRITVQQTNAADAKGRWEQWSYSIKGGGWGGGFKSREDAIARAAAACFSDLAPSTLARIVEDCARYATNFNLKSTPEGQAQQGREWWAFRRPDRLSGYPPLRLYLADDGLIHISTEGDA